MIDERMPIEGARRLFGATPLLLFAIAGAGCRSGPATPPGSGLPTAAAITPGPSAPGGAGPAAGGSDAGLSPDDAAAIRAAQLPGRLVAIAPDPEDFRNWATVLDLEAATDVMLWETADGVNASDWSPAPDGSRVAYRAIERLGEATVAKESIIVRELTADATPREIVSVDTARARLAGFVWSADGRAIAYGRRVGGGAGAASNTPPVAEAWEVRIIDIDPAAVEAVALTPEPGAAMPGDRVVWRADGAAVGSAALSVAGWDPAAGRIALTEVAGEARVASAVRIIDTKAGEEVGRVDIEAPALSVVPSPGGRYLALPEWDTTPPTPPRMRVLTPASAEVTHLASLEPGIAINGPAWSPDGAWLAWVELPADPTGPPRVRAMPVTGEGAGFTATLEGSRDAQHLAFAPDGRAVVVSLSAGETETWDRIEALRVPDGRRLPLPWAPPAGTWGMGWVP